MSSSIQNRKNPSVYKGDIELSPDELDIINEVSNRDDLGYAEIVDTGISFSRELTFDEWKELGLHIRQRVDGYRWAIGDFINAGKDDWGDYYTHASEITDYSISSLRKFAMVSGGYELFRRRNKLTYSHHVEAFVTENPAKWLERAESKNWSVRRLRDEINSTKELPKPEKPLYSSMTRKAYSLSKTTEKEFGKLPDSERLEIINSMAHTLKQFRKWDKR